MQSFTQPAYHDMLAIWSSGMRGITTRRLAVEFVDCQDFHFQVLRQQAGHLLSTNTQFGYLPECDCISQNMQVAIQIMQM